MDCKMEAAPMNGMERGRWNGEVVMLAQPLLDEWALNGGVQEVWAESGLFAAVHCESPVLVQEAGIP